MNKIGILLTIIILISNNGFSQDSFRKVILSDLKKGDLSSCFERIEMNKPIIDSYHLLTFNEFWTICHLCEKPIPLTDFYKQKSLRQLYRMKTDSLAIILFSLAKENEIQLNNIIDEIYKNKVEHTINELFLNMLLSNSKDSIRNFNEKRDKIVEENMKNEKEYPDSLFDLIQYQEIRNKLMVSGSLEFKKYSNQIFYGQNELINRNYGLSFSLSGPRFYGAILMGYSFDINLIESFDQKYYSIRDQKYYLPEYSDTSNVKLGIGLSWSIGILLFNNQNFNASLSGFMSGFSYEKDNGYACAGISLASNIYLPKYQQHLNINGSLNSRKAFKLSFNYDFINYQASIGIGISLNKIKRLHYLNTNYIMNNH